jgi:predicted nucleic-acid-binding protein
MIGLDTNILLRRGDDREPARKLRAHALVRALGSGGSFVNSVVLSEFAWTLAKTCKLSRREIADRMTLLLRATEFVVAHAEEAERALELFRAGPAGPADYLRAEINRSAGCEATATFDGDALKSPSNLFVPVPALFLNDSRDPS